MILLYTLIITTLVMTAIAAIIAYYDSKIIIGYAPMDTVEWKRDISIPMLVLNIFLAAGINLMYAKYGFPAKSLLVFVVIILYNQTLFWTVLELFENFFKKNRIYYNLEDEEEDVIKLSDKIFGFIGEHYRSKFILFFKLSIISSTLYYLV